MLVSQWHTVDGTIDNTVAMASQNGEYSVAAQGLGSRETGWAATKAHPRNADGWGGWPPQGDEITVALPVSDWRYVARELRRWHDVSCDAGQLAMAQFVTERLPSSD